MRDKYAGDVGDFGKYVLLNALLDQDKTIRLGINWCYVLDEEDSNDGRFIEYLDPNNPNYEKYRRCNPRIHQILSELVSGQRRSVQSIESSSIFRKRTVFYRESISLPNANVAIRCEERKRWFRSSHDSLASADIIFLDPDNGIQTPNVRKTQKRASKFVFLDEVQDYFSLGKSIILYNHRDYTPTETYNAKLKNVGKQLEIKNEMLVLKFCRYSVRHYLFLPQRQHQILFDKVICRLTEPPIDHLFANYVLQ